MDAATIDMPSSRITLSCVICGAAPMLAGTLHTRLERSARVGAIERLDDALTLERTLTLRHVDLVVQVVGATDRTLPRCLLEHADVRVLVIAPDGAQGPLSHWLQQGANDLVIGADGHAHAHALSRLLDECALLATLRRQQTIIETQRRRIEMLATTTTPSDFVPRAVCQSVSTQPDSDPSDQRHLAQREQAPVDTRDGLPGRRLTLRRLKSLCRRASSGVDQPIIAARLVFPFDRQCVSPVERTRCDLTICRAVSVIRRRMPNRLLLGRISSDTLLLLLPDDGARAERDAEIALRLALGTLGDLLERPEELSIDTLAGPMSQLAARNLESRFDDESSATLAIDMSAAIRALPLLTARSVSVSPRLAAARS